MLCIDIFHVDSYHLRCIGLTAKDTGLRDYKCPYCEILKGKSHYSNGGALLVGYYFILTVDYWSFFIFFWKLIYCPIILLLYAEFWEAYWIERSCWSSDGCWKFLSVVIWFIKSVFASCVTEINFLQQDLLFNLTETKAQILCILFMQDWRKRCSEPTCWESPCMQILLERNSEPCIS